MKHEHTRTGNILPLVVMSSCRGSNVVLLVMETLKSWPQFSTGMSSPVVVALLATVLVSMMMMMMQLLLERKKLPPGPVAWPVVGNFPALGGALPHRVLRRLATKYGGLMYLRLGSVPTIVVSTVAVSKELFQTLDATFLDRPRCMYFDVVTDGRKNMAVSNGRYWRHLRKLCASELFTPKRLASYQRDRGQELHAMMKELASHRGDADAGRVVDLKRWLQAVTSNSMTRMLVNKRYFGNSSDGKKEREDFEAMIARTFDLSGAFIISDFIPSLTYFTKWQGWQKKMEELRDCTYEIGGRMLEIDKHRQRAEHPTDENHVPDFLDVLLKTPLEDGKVLPDKNLILVLMLDLISAGTETSATAVEWAVAELVQQPEIMQKLQSELTNIVGLDRVVLESDLPNLPFLQATVKETLRLHPPAALNLPRESSRPFTFRGYRFPERTRLMINFFAIHRDASVYGESAEVFRPERFMERPEVSPAHGFEYYELTPFSAGRRMCPAADLGYMMVCFMLAHLMHGFDWALPEGTGSVDMAEQFGLTVSMKQALRLVATPKRPAFLY